MKKGCEKITLINQPCASRAPKSLLARQLHRYLHHHMATQKLVRPFHGLPTLAPRVRTRRKIKAMSDAFHDSSLGVDTACRQCRHRCCGLLCGDQVVQCAVDHKRRHVAVRTCVNEAPGADGADLLGHGPWKTSPVVVARIAVSEKLFLASAREPVDQDRDHLRGPVHVRADAPARVA